MGSKARIAKHILPLILSTRKEGQWYVEPFVGGANTIDKVSGNRIGADVNHYLVSLLNALSTGWTPPKEVTRDFFFEVKADKDSYPDELVAYLGYQLTFGCEWWGSFRRDNTRERKYDLEAYNNVVSVWEKEIPSNGNNSIKSGQGIKATEKLFIHKSQRTLK